VFDQLNPAGLLAAVRRAFALFRRPDEWAAVQQRGMRLRFDWRTAALHYLAMYQSLRPSAK
ncbi:MAG: starch synthase, partial [Gallionella sp.]|nr:starch synthase [Gallionella sp.]